MAPGTGVASGRGRLWRRLGQAGKATAPLALGLTLTLAACGGGSAPNPTGLAGQTSENGVRVVLRWEPGAGAGGVLATTFTPEQPGFHLYSLELPPAGVDGVGRPTRVEVGGALATAGQPTADKPVVALRVPGVSVALPVFPDGPVTIRLPVHRTASAGDVWAQLSYAACSESVCLAPVTERRVPLALPAG
ncbi:MAG: hypothetical protein HY241_16460 [Actinobacteria bacterium]|nr:hypothetical protein [Actinomycetota bacterium]